MKLSTKGRYAVTAMVDLASAKEQRPISLAEISSRQGISLSYLEQLFAKLRRKSLVASVRGPGGGYRLAQAAEDIRVAEIIIAVDESLDLTGCKSASSHGCTAKSGRCLTHDLWDELGRQVYLYLNSVTLEDVALNRVVQTGLQPVNKSQDQPQSQQFFR